MKMKECLSEKKMFAGVLKITTWRFSFTLVRILNRVQNSTNKYYLSTVLAFSSRVIEGLLFEEMISFSRSLLCVATLFLGWGRQGHYLSFDL